MDAQYSSTQYEPQGWWRSKGGWRKLEPSQPKVTSFHSLEGTTSSHFLIHTKSITSHIKIDKQSTKIGVNNIVTDLLKQTTSWFTVLHPSTLYDTVAYILAIRIEHTVANGTYLCTTVHSCSLHAAKRDIFIQGNIKFHVLVAM